jgi:hypothetical protein
MRIDIKHYAIPSPGVRAPGDAVFHQEVFGAFHAPLRKGFVVFLRAAGDLHGNRGSSGHQACISDNLESIPFEEIRTVWTSLRSRMDFFVSCCGMLLGDSSHEFCSALTPSFHPVARRSTLISESRESTDLKICRLRNIEQTPRGPIKIVDCPLLYSSRRNLLGKVDAAAERPCGNGAST